MSDAGGGADDGSSTRASRRARVEDRLDAPVRSRPGAGAGSALGNRLGATDRDGRFRHRLVAVHADARRRRRRARTLRVASTAAVALVALALGVAVAGRTDRPWAGVATAAGLVALFLAGRHVAAALAAARGPDAWDWQAGRHRLMGRPAKRVQELDHPVGRASDRRR